jgi:hypothetical protein
MTPVEYPPLTVLVLPLVVNGTAMFIAGDQRNNAAGASVLVLQKMREQILYEVRN